MSRAGCGSDTREHQQAAATTQNNRTVHEGVQHVVSLDENVCPRKWNTSAPACGGVQLDDNYNTGDENSMGATDVLQAVAGCGCVPVQPECSTGARGGVACKYGKGEYEKAMERSHGCPGGRKLLPAKAREDELGQPLEANGTCTTQPRRGRTKVGSAATLPVYDFAPRD